MQNKDIKRRIQQLAKQSNQLKKIAKEGADSSRITNIINQSKRNLENDWYNSQNTFLKVQQTKYNSSKQIIEQKSKISGSFRFIGIKNSPKQNTFEQNISINIKSNYRIQQQILLLREQNVRLQKQNRSLRKLLQQRQKQSDIPFFKIQQQADLFYTRIYVRVEDYDKIDFNKYIMKLEQTTLYINKLSQSSPWKILVLSQIKIVKYLGEMIMIQFQSHVGTQYLFIKYKDNQQQKKWDLALYINKIIKQCQNKVNLFIQQPQIKSNFKPRKHSSSIKHQRRKTSMNQQQNHKIQNNIIHNRKQIEFDKRQSQQDRLKYRQNTMSSRRQKSQTSESSLSKKFQIQKNKLDQLISKSNRTVKDTNRLDQQILQKRRKIMESKNHHIQQNIAKIHWIPPTDDNNTKKQTTSLLKSINNTQEKASIKIEKQKKQDQISKENNIQKSYNIKNTVIQQPSAYEFDGNASNNLQKIQQANRMKIIDSLKKPKNFLKYAKGGFRPRDKQVYLSQNQSQLCWKDYQTKKIGKIRIQDITELQIGVLGPGMIKQSKNLNPDLCLVIKTNQRILELSAQRKEALDKFANQLGFLLQEYQQGTN